MDIVDQAEYNKSIYKKLSEVVVGHDQAKKVLINMVNRSQLRYYQKWLLLEENYVKISNCLLVGESGTGKTFLVETLSKIMNFPLVRIDATELQPTGASGGIKKKDLINKIHVKAEQVLKESPDSYFSKEGTIDQVIVFVDEIDKLGLKLSSDWNKDVQSNFLTVFENYSELEGVTFIFAGAFSGMEREDKKPPSIGFNNSHNVIKQEVDLAESIIKWGIMPELVGRFNNIVLLDDLKEKDYREILLNKVVPDARNYLEFYGVRDFQLSESQIKMIVKNAMKSGLGARSLETSVNRLLIDIEFDPNSYKKELDL